MTTSYYIGYCTDRDIRFKASSGGIGTAIIQYLLSKSEFGTSITFAFDKEKCAYVPKLIYSFDEYNNCGSIYQDINIYEFIKNNIDNVKGGIVLTCPPCQVAPIRNLLNNRSINNFIISFCCSGQTTVEGTWFYYKSIGVKKEEVQNIQYRGNGWPSGIQISLKNEERRFYKNYTEPWVTIHRAGFFRPQRCWLCRFGTSVTSDISLGDPWIKDYIDNDSIGNSVFFANTEQGRSVIDELNRISIIGCKKVDPDVYLAAQTTTESRRKRTKQDIENARTQYKYTQKVLVRSLCTSNVVYMRCYLKILQKIIHVKRLFKR